jgi:hypothetical protein
MPQPSPRARLIAKGAGALAALALFVSSLASLLALDGQLEGALSAERRATSVPVAVDVNSRQHDRDCPWTDQGRTQHRLRS